MSTKSMLDACSSGNSATVSALLQRKPGLLHCTGESGQTPLEAAAWQPSDAVVKLLLSSGANVRATRPNGVTPLHVAAQEGHNAVAKALLAGGAHVNAAEEDGTTPLYMAAQVGQSDVAKALLAAGADVNAATRNGVTPLTIAAYNGHSGVVTALLAAGADVSKAKKDGATPLSAAVQNGRNDVVKSLLAAGADANATAKDGALPLFVAAMNGRSDVAKTLLAVGADVDAANEDGVTPLVIAVQEGHHVVVKTLLVAGADVNKVWKYGATPLYVAAQHGLSDVAKALLAAGADVNAARLDGVTPLSITAQQGHNNMVKALLAAGADVNAARDDGATPLYFAAEVGRNDMVKVLLAAGADVDASSRAGATPLLVAAKYGHDAVAETLLSWGASLACTTAKNETPMSVTLDGTHLAVACVLVRWGADKSDWGTSRTVSRRSLKLRFAVRDVTVLSKDESSSIVARNRSSVTLASAVESSGGSSRSGGDAARKLTVAFVNLADQPAALSWSAMKHAVESCGVVDLPSLAAAHRVLQLGVAAGVCPSALTSDVQGTEAASVRTWCYESVYLPAVGHLQPGESGMCRAIFANALHCGLLDKMHHTTLVGLLAHDSAIQGQFARVLARLDVLERIQDALCDAGSRVYENVQQLRRSLDERDRRRRKVAVATSCVKVGVSLVPLVGAALGSGAEAAICAVADAACTESLAAGSVVIRFFADNGDLAAARDILSAAKDKLPAPELAALERCIQPQYQSLEDLLNQLEPLCGSSPDAAADDVLGEGGADVAPDGPVAGATGEANGSSEGGTRGDHGTGPSQCDAASADGSVAGAADGVRDTVVDEAVPHGVEALAGSDGTFQQDPTGAAPSPAPTSSAGNSGSTGTADLSTCSIDQLVGRLTDYVCMSYTPDRRAEYLSAVSTSAHRNEVDGLSALRDDDPAGLATCLLADYRGGALPRGPLQGTVAFLRQAQREWQGE